MLFLCWHDNRDEHKSDNRYEHKSVSGLFDILKDPYIESKLYVKFKSDVRTSDALVSGPNTTVNPLHSP